MLGAAEPARLGFSAFELSQINSMIILGLNAFHGGSAAALVRDGKLVAAVEEERFRRIKHWAGFPALAIASCLSQAGLTLPDVDHVAINQDSRAHLWRKLFYMARGGTSPRLALARLATRRKRENLPA